MIQFCTVLVKEVRCLYASNSCYSFFLQSKLQFFVIKNISRKSDSARIIVYTINKCHILLVCLLYDFIFKAVQKGTRFYLASQSWCCHQKAQDPNTDHASSSQTYSANVLRFHWMKNSIIPVKKDLRHLEIKSVICVSF